jgi:hypothetical protein
MGLDITITEKSGCLFIRAAGHYSLENMKDLFATIVSKSEERGYNHVLLNTNAVAGSIPELDRFLLGEHAASLWRPKLKMAIVSQPENINKFAENVAVNRGANLQILDDDEKALEWLIGETAYMSQ